MKRRCFLALPMAAYAATSRDLRKRLYTSLERVEAIDTHEHIVPESERTSQPADFFTLASHYALDDVTSAGLPDEARKLIESADAAPDRKWQAFEPWWRYARSTGYGEALRIAMRDIYGVADISAATLPRLNGAIANRNKPGLYEYVLKERMRLRFAVNDEYWKPGPNPVDKRYFVLARKFENWIGATSPRSIQQLEKLSGASITDVASMKKALEQTFRRSLEIGMVTVKSTAAYQRSLRFNEVSEADAQRDFDALMRGSETIPQGFRRYEETPFRRLSDHIFHTIVQLADAHKVPFQIHTGLHAGNGNYVTNSRPTLLTNLFNLYPRVRFDLFHIGYPYHHETAVLAKLYPNVHADFCWMHIVSPSAARAALTEMLDAVPANKIMGFGGDYRYPELSYGHLVMARRNIADVLAARVEAGSSTEEEAAELGRWLLHDNPARLFAPAQGSSQVRNSN